MHKPALDNPALSAPLTGKVLIEASAGTGKTWTLTALILRLLLERGVPCQQIIATTFTRKASAELKRRIVERLDECARAYEQQSALPLAERLQTLDDPLLTHLFQIYQEDDESWVQLGKRLRTAQAQLEQMYIGTLDGLCQKWLLENRLETGVDAQLRMVENPQLAQTLVHQQLRAFHHHTAAQYPTQYPDLLMGYDSLRDSASCYQNTESALIFSRATLLPPQPFSPVIAPTLPEIQALEDWREWLDTLPRDKSKFREERIVQLMQLGAGQTLSSADLEKLSALLCNPPFKKGGEREKSAFQNHPITQHLITLLNHHQQKQYAQQQLAQSALFEVAKQLRQQLPALLEEQRYTTFSHNLQRLNQALETHLSLAHHIHHRYPVILVDESQDLNDEQSALIEKLYLQISTPHRYLLLVGDPKQAIYQFRGGDVENYRRLKKQFRPEECFQLTENYRSNQTLLDALNHHYAVYQGQQPFGCDIDYHKVHAAKPEAQLVHRAGKKQAMYWITVEKADDESRQIADLIAHLLSPESAFVWRDGRAIQASDILLLMRSGKQLEEVQNRLLQKYHLSADLQTERSIFHSPIASALLTLLQAIQKPRHQGLQNRLLSGLFYQYNLAQLEQETPLALTAKLSQAQQRWQQYGLLSALHAFLYEQEIWGKLARDANNGRQWVSDLRRLLEIIAERGKLLRPEAFILWWQQQLSQCPTAEWAQPYTITQPQSVRLMTIHKAKGLQAPLVIVGGLRKIKQTHQKEAQLFNYYEHEQRYLSANPPNPSILETMLKADMEEGRRLLYVALTRAEQLLFVYHLNSSHGAQTVQELYEQGACPASDTQYPQPPAPQPPQPISVATPTISATSPHLKEKFVGHYRSSFSGLTAGISVEIPDYDGQSAFYPNPDVQSPTPALPFQTLLPRGAQAGSFMHAVLEKLPLEQPQKWETLVQRLAQRFQLPSADETLSDYMKWLNAIVHTPLHGSEQSLQQLNRKALCREMGFTLRVNTHHSLPNALNQLFAKYGKALYLDKNDARIYRYLRGEIDLVYQHDNRFYIVDYKTNLLPEYSPSALEHSMNHHQYWLQAALYQLTLYRFLKRHQPKDKALSALGAVNYFYLRGLAQHSWQIPHDMLDELDQLLG